MTYRTITTYKLHMIIVTNYMKYFKKKERKEIKKKNCNECKACHLLQLD